MKIKQAMILAAGYGKRMRPITNFIPKPMVFIAGKTIIERIIDNLIQNRIKTIVINTHYKSDIFQQYIKNKYFKNRKVKIIFSNEKKLLGSGGGIVNALKKGYLKNEPMFYFNSDTIFIPNKNDHLESLYNEFIKTKALIIFNILDHTKFHGIEDRPFYMLGKNRLDLTRLDEGTGKYSFIGSGILDPKVFTDYPNKNEKFSLSETYIALSKDKKLFGTEFNGEAFHIDRPEKMIKYEKIIAKLENKSLKI